jgi:sterol-4alpha-carboxylate 3-dehydrogenase (decarboxylating)
MASKSNLGDVLVIGGCGYLGSKLVTELLSDHLEAVKVESVHVMSRSPTQNLHPDAKYHAGNISNHDQVSSLLEKIKPTVIFHTASPKYTASEALLRSTNIDGTRVLLQCAAECQSVKAFIYTGTDSAIVQAPGVRLTEEIAELHTEKSSVNLYAKTKAIADSEVRAANNPLKLKTAVIRLPGLYGEDDDNCVGTLLGSVKKNQHKIQIGENKKHFEFVYVKSAYMAHILAAKALLDERHEAKVDGEAFFVTDGVSMPYFDFARKIYAGAGYPVAESEIKVMSYGMILFFAILGEWIYWIFTFGTRTPELRKQAIEYLDGGTQWNINKAKERLGYEPVTDQDAIIEQVAKSEAKRLGIFDKKFD